jgi:hypothetical protein
MQVYYSEVILTYLLMEWVYSLHIFTTVVDGALWSNIMYQIDAHVHCYCTRYKSSVR